MEHSKKLRDMLFLTNDVRSCKIGSFIYEYQAYLDLETGEATMAYGLLQMDRFIRYCPPKGIREQTVCHLKGCFREDRDTDFEVEEVVEINVRSPAFDGILEERKKPIIVHDDLLGTVRFERVELRLEGWVEDSESEIGVVVYGEWDLKESWLELLKAAYTTFRQIPKNLHKEPLLQRLLEKGNFQLSEANISIEPRDRYYIYIALSNPPQRVTLDIMGSMTEHSLLSYKYNGRYQGERQIP